jgi:tetratricopeptide (TPR) repeat protein
LGALYVSEGRYVDAAEMFSRVITLVPDSFRGYSNLGGAYILLGRYADATNVLAQSIKIRATPDAYSNLGTAFYHLRKFDEAAVNYLRATKLNDRQYILWGNLGDAYYYSGRRTESFGAYEKAVSLAKAQLQVNPRDSSVLGNLASYLSMLGDRSASLSYLSGALGIAGSTDPNLLFEAAMIYNQFGETASALEWLAKSLDAGFSPSTVSDAPALANLHGLPKFQELLRGRSEGKQQP